MNVLLLVDLQNDFLPGGPLGVPDGEATIPVANRLQLQVDHVVASQDWHPPDHVSFAANHEGRKPGDTIEVDGLAQILWPVHCVQDSPGAELADGLDTERIAQVFRKGVDPRIDSYSAFYDNGNLRSTGLGGYLKRLRPQRLFVLGLATDVCVKFTALDARKLGFDTWVVDDGCRGIELVEGDIERAIWDMKDAGCHWIVSTDV